METRKESIPSNSRTRMTQPEKLRIEELRHNYAQNDSDLDIALKELASTTRDSAGILGGRVMTTLLIKLEN